MISEIAIADALVKANIVSREIIDELLNVSRKEMRSLSSLLIEREIVKPDQLGQLIANVLKVQYVDLRREAIPSEVLNIVPEVVAAKKLVIAFRRDAEGLKVAMADPEDLSMVKLLEKKTGDRVIAYYSNEAFIRQALSQYRKDFQHQFQEIIRANVVKARGARPEDVSVIKIVDSLIAYGHQNKSSDVHIEPHKDQVIVRFRIDGILHDVLSLPLNILDLVVTRIKILSKLRTDEHRSAQDGKMTMTFEGEEVDIRVSILPTTTGEKVVMRLLTPDSRLTSLEELGLNQKELQVVQQAIERPHGMILSTGPTGSGKTTTLYSLIRIVNKRDVNISTIEDPVEYYLEGVNQVQVNPKTNLTFAQGLRSLLRQDPDIIMVGEIRDEETASIAINAAMTGHLVLSTLHTNDAPTALPRLIDMHIEPFLIASTVDIIIAQRLVRKVCTKCIVSKSYTADDLIKLIGTDVDVSTYAFEGVIRTYFGKGCISCANTGYQGRLGIFEVLIMSDTIRELIVNKADADQIRQAARAGGMRTMFEDGIEKVVLGKTTIDEILRVVKA